MTNRSLTRTALSACSFLLALGAAPAMAQSEGGHLAPSGAMTLSVSFGQKVAFGLGLDFRVTGLLGNSFLPCSSGSRGGLGPFAQIALLNFRAMRVAVGVHGGGEVHRQNVSVDGEIGWTYRSAFAGEGTGQHGVHLGALGGFFIGPHGSWAPAIEIPVRVAVPLTGEPRAPEITPGVAARFPPIFGMARTCVY